MGEEGLAGAVEIVSVALVEVGCFLLALSTGGVSVTGTRLQKVRV